jgi:sugar lactone lactonase YvrE
VTDLLDVKDASLHDLIPEDATVERIAGGFGFTEGPVWYRDGLLFSDIRKNRIVRWRELREGPEVTTFSLGYSNGLTLDRTGDVIAAEHGGRRVSRVAADGTRRTIVDRYQGLRLNSPNDLVVKSDGSIYFTDPPYAVSANVVRGPEWWLAMLPGKQQRVNGVYRLSPDGRLDLLVEDFALPNGLAFSPDERTLYVDDSERKHIRAFDVATDGSLAGGRVLLDMASPDPGVPDGMKVDHLGNLYCTGPGGIWVCRPNGDLLGRILLPELPANLAWGDDWTRLFVTARTSMYRIRTRTQGVPLP